MHRPVNASWLFLLALSAGCGDATGSGSGGVPACLTSEEVALLRVINSARADSGLAALAVDTRLVQAARYNTLDWVNGNILPADSGGRYGYLGGLGGTEGGPVGGAQAFWDALFADPGTALLFHFMFEASTTQVGVAHSPDPADGPGYYGFVAGSGAGPAARASCAP